MIFFVFFPTVVFFHLKPVTDQILIFIKKLQLIKIYYQLINLFYSRNFYFSYFKHKFICYLKYNYYLNINNSVIYLITCQEI
jgi:hypothetical protein